MKDHRAEVMDGVPTGWCSCGKAWPHDRGSVSETSYEGVLTLLNEALAEVLIVQGPTGNAVAAGVFVERVLLARNRLSVLVAQNTDDAEAVAAGNFI